MDQNRLRFQIGLSTLAVKIHNATSQQLNDAVPLRSRRTSPIKFLLLLCGLIFLPPANARSACDMAIDNAPLEASSSGTFSLLLNCANEHKTDGTIYNSLAWMILYGNVQYPSEKERVEDALTFWIRSAALGENEPLRNIISVFKSGLPDIHLEKNPVAAECLSKGESLKGSERWETIMGCLPKRYVQIQDAPLVAQDCSNERIKVACVLAPAKTKHVF